MKKLVFFLIGQFIFLWLLNHFFVSELINSHDFINNPLFKSSYKAICIVFSYSLYIYFSVMIFLIWGEKKNGKSEKAIKLLFLILFTSITCCFAYYFYLLYIQESYFWELSPQQYVNNPFYLEYTIEIKKIVLKASQLMKLAVINLNIIIFIFIILRFSQKER